MIYANVTLKIPYVLMFGKRNYVDQMVAAVEQISPGEFDTKRVTFYMAIYEKHWVDVVKFATSYEIIKDDRVDAKKKKLRTTITELKDQMHELENLLHVARQELIDV